MDTGDGLKAVRVVTLPASTAGTLALGAGTVTANQKIVRGSLGTLKFAPAANWNGDASFTFKVVDGSDAESVAATATITVSKANDAPTAGALGVSTSEDTALTFTAADFDGVFTDVDTGDSLKAVRVATLPAATAGALTLGAGAVTGERRDRAWLAGDAGVHAGGELERRRELHVQGRGRVGRGVGGGDGDDYGEQGERRADRGCAGGEHRRRTRR